MKGKLVVGIKLIYIQGQKHEFLGRLAMAKREFCLFEHRISVSTSIAFFRWQTLILAEI